MFQPVGPPPGETQPLANLAFQAPLVVGDGVQRMADTVHDVPQFVQGSLFYYHLQKVQLHSNRRADLPASPEPSQDHVLYGVLNFCSI